VLFDHTQSAAAFHNAYPVQWAKLNRDAVNCSADVAFFTRSGGLLTPGVTTLMWLGDQLTTWDSYDGLWSALIGMLGSGGSFSDVRCGVGN
jgi:sulfoquinovosidase